MVKNQINSCCHMGCPPMIGDLHFHRGYSLRLQESKPLKNNGIISQAVRHGLTAATEAQATIVARVWILMVSLLLWCCRYYTPCAQFLLSAVVLATAGRSASRRLFAARRLRLQREAIERHAARNPFEHGGEWS